jgi:hypothetical protein
VINPAGIKTMCPSLSGDVTQYGGVLVVVLYHEIKHADGSYDSSICQEIAAQYHVAQQACNLVCYIIGELPGANVSPLCAMYRDTQNRYNHGVATPGGAPAAFAAAGCSGTFPGTVPDCPCCP